MTEKKIFKIKPYFPIKFEYKKVMYSVLKRNFILCNSDLLTEREYLDYVFNIN